jgi:hypothetical protein
MMILLAVLSVIAGSLLSGASLAGRAGISLFYSEYGFLKVWWQAALAIFVLWMILLVVQRVVHNKAALPTARIVHVFALLLALAGLYFTYYDFRHSLSHRLLGERFHLGAYLFWFGWMIISLFYLLQKKHKALYTTSVE